VHHGARHRRPYRIYENAMKRYLARRFSRGRWNLCVDIDERFDYPFSDSLPLSALLAYLDRRGYTAVVSQMLDLFSAEPLGTPAGSREAPALRFQLCDLSGLRTRPYRWGTLSDPAVREHRGGIRDQVFHTDNGLSKAALVRVGEGSELFVDYHHVGRAARIADFTCLLRHYPFGEGFREKVEEAARTGRYGPLTTPQYENYRDVLREQGELRLKRATAREYRGTQALLESGFLVASQEFHRWSAVHARAPGRPAQAGELAAAGEAHGG